MGIHFTKPIVTGILFLLLFSAPLWALDVPPTPTTAVNDLAGMMSRIEVQQLEENLQRYAAGKPYVAIVVLTVPSLQDTSLEDYAQRVFDAWAIGNADKDNGVLLLVSKGDRKIRIHAGYGVEGKLTDGISGTIIRNVISPHFKEERFGEGISAGCDAIAGTISGEFNAADAMPSTSPRQARGSSFGGILFIIIFILIACSRRGRQSGLLWFLLGATMGGGRRGGGGFGGGGFGGFGGGSSGGGGASGSW